MTGRILPRIALALTALVIALPLSAQIPADWTTPFPPFRVAGNLYYVGSKDLAAYLIVTPKGNILINSNLASSPGLILKSVESLGFRFSDIKILLISHAHYDHCAGSAEIQQLTGAEYDVMSGDEEVVASGGKWDFQYGKDWRMRYLPAHVNRLLHDGDTVSLGGTTLTAHRTAGHTKGTTTWTLDETENGRMLHVVIVGSPNVNPGYKLVNNKAYPQIAADYRHGFEVLKNLPCDVFLGAHGGYFDPLAKYERFKKGERNAFIDPDGYRAYIAEREQAFEAELKKQSAAKH